MSLPVIDFGGLRTGDRAAREQIVSDVGAAMEEWGFFQVVNHSVPDELQDRMDAQARNYFNLPLDVKKRAELEGPNSRGFGFSELLRSAKSKTSSNTESVLMKESIADTRAPSYSNDFAAKIWPDGDLTFSNTVHEYCLAVEALGHQILELLADRVGVQRDFYSRHYKNPDERCGSWRLHHFPANPGPFHVLKIVPHSDPVVLTLLQQDVCGLQVKKPEDAWIDVKQLPRGFMVIIGDILEAWSNGRFTSVEHRVAIDADCERLSVIVFLDALPSLRIEAPPELIDDGHPSLFVPFVSSDFRAYFEKIKKLGDIRKGLALDSVRRRLV